MFKQLKVMADNLSNMPTLSYSRCWIFLPGDLNLRLIQLSETLVNCKISDL